jgi:hypothetical protein
MADRAPQPTSVAQQGQGQPQESKWSQLFGIVQVSANILHHLHIHHVDLHSNISVAY